MVIRSKAPTGPAPVAVVPPAHDMYIAGDAIPVPEVIEKNTDSVWAMWSEAIDGKPERDDETQPATLLMGLPDMPKDRD